MRGRNRIILAMRWDIFCRVIDNFGDIGVAWRLATNLASRGQQVRLWVDDASALRWMAPQGQQGVDVIEGFNSAHSTEPADVVIETFGCELPASFLARMAVRPQAPVWINLEYLSAEPYVLRSHGLRSPQSAGPAAGLDKWFFYPGFTAGTGGLLREPGLIERLRRHDLSDRHAWLRQRGWAPQGDERVVMLFCYDIARGPEWLTSITTHPTLLLVCSGAVQMELISRPLPPHVRMIGLPWLDQPDFDALLCCADLNVVRGEDSFVRAMWAGRPFIWQIYRQADGAHAAKLDAFMAQFCRAMPCPTGADIQALWRAWNHLGPWPSEPPNLDAWGHLSMAWRSNLLGQIDLCTQLIEFAAKRR